MFQVFPSMKPQFSQISLPRLSQILPDPKPNRLAEDIEIIMQSFFDNDLSQDRVNECHERIDSQPFDKKQFFEIINKPLLKILKREEKKIEELIELYHNRPIEQRELNRIRLDKILKECFSKILNSSKLIYQFVEFMQRITSWECNCNKKLCQDRQSFIQFCKDIFGFFYRSSKVINRQIHGAIERQVELNPLYLQIDQIGKEEWKFNNKPGQLILQIQSSCDLAKNKKKKRNKKNKDKQVASEIQQKVDQADQDERLLCSFMETLDVSKVERVDCIVTQDWLQKIAVHKHLNAK